MKLIDLLVQELPKWGGWPEGVDAVEQDSEGQLFEIDSDYCSDFKLEKCDDWIADVVTKQQYESALAASKAVVGHDEWIEWHGGDCPVDSDAIVEVKFRWHDQHQYNNDRAGDFYWSHTGSNADIIAYRLKQPTKSEQAFDDVAGDDDEADLNECIGQDIDVVNHPSHYTKGRIECIDAIDSATTGKSGIEAVCVANLIKYLWRYEEKGGLESVRKAQWYLNRLIEELSTDVQNKTRR